MSKILWFLDIDGCLSAGKFARFDLAACQRLEALVKERDLAVVLCTGRSLSYLEALGQLLRVGRYALADHGTLLYDYDTDQSWAQPGFDAAARARLESLRQQLRALGEANGRWRLSHGKEASVSLVATAGDALGLRETMERAVDLTGFALHPSGRVLDIVSAGMDKWSGARFYLEKFPLGPGGRLGAIGDSGGDLPILRRVDVAACPANAAPAVKEICHYVSPAPDIHGVLDILSRPFPQ